MPKLAVPLRHSLGEFDYPIQSFLSIYGNFPSHSLPFVSISPLGQTGLIPEVYGCGKRNSYYLTSIVTGTLMAVNSFD
jgi:hypothetical protein